MRRFKTAGHAQRFLSAFGMIASHFRPKRHLLTAQQNRDEGEVCNLARGSFYTSRGMNELVGRYLLSHFSPLAVKLTVPHQSFLDFFLIEPVTLTALSICYIKYFYWGGG
jgi:hypothetical protein